MKLKVIILMCLPLLSFAAIPNWQIVPDKSALTFTATQNNAPVTGTFKTFTGNIQFDPAQLNNSHVNIIINMASVNTSYGDVATTLITPDWFNAKMFPQAVFKADHFTKTGDKSFQAQGQLTIRDKTQPVVLSFNLEQYSPTNALVKGSTTLKRTAFGVGQGDFASTDEVKDDVVVNFNLTATSK